MVASRPGCVQVNTSQLREFATVVEAAVPLVSNVSRQRLRHFASFILSIWVPRKKKKKIVNRTP